MTALTAFRSLCHHTCLKAGAAFGMALFMMTLSPPTAAQVSTGGVIPPADDPHFGWSIQRHPLRPYTLDWTGLDVAVTRTYFNPPGGSDNYPPGVKSYEYVDFHYPVEYNHGGVGGSYNGDGPGLSYSSLSVSGFSSFQWRWTPPNIPGTSTPDTDNFPVPPLYALGRITGSLEFRPQSSRLDNLTAFGTLSDGWGGPNGAVFPSGVPSTGTLTGERRKILGPASAAGANFEVRLSPSITTSLTGQSEGGKAYTLAGLSESVNAIHLSEPDILGRPDLGDGKNQFTYGEVLSGQLLLPVKINMPGAGQSDHQWLVDGNHVDVKVLPGTPEQNPLQNQFPYTWSAFDYYVTPRTDITSNAHLYGSYVYDGLPTYNSEYGDRTAVMQIDTKVSEQARFQVFFRPRTSEYPNGDPDWPNWYYYYNQVFNRSATYYMWFDKDMLDTAALCHVEWALAPLAPHGYRITQNYILIGPEAIDIDEIPVFALRSGPAVGQQHIHWIGVLKVYGVHRYIRTYEEELAHAILFDNYTVLPPGLYNGERPNVLDSDLDLVPDDVERRLGLDPNDPDSTNYYPHYIALGLSGDAEVPAAILALKELISFKDTWKKDWAQYGLQFGSRPPYPTTPERQFFPWTFQTRSERLPDGSYSSVTVSGDLPSDALLDLPNLPQ